MNISEQHAWEH